MKIEKKELWKEKVGMCEKIPTITAILPDNKKSDMAILAFPGGGYGGLTDYEGGAYARFLAEKGFTAFFVDYRVAPHRFPLPLLDARRAIRTVRYNADKYGIDKNKIAVMGSSAGGHLAALCSTYFEPIEFEGVDEIDKEDFIPNYQILCYPVISLAEKEFAHFGSGQNLLGEKLSQMGKELSPELIVSEKTPPAFIWHTLTDNIVNVKNSLVYAEKLKEVGVGAELHIFPDGEHGLGLSKGEDKISKHNSQWADLLINWLRYVE